MAPKSSVSTLPLMSEITLLVSTQLRAPTIATTADIPTIRLRIC
jgi:hypothetical protein